MTLNEIYECESQMWEAVKYRDRNKYLSLVSKDAVIISRGFFCSGQEYSEILDGFDLRAFTITEFEKIAGDDTFMQIRYRMEFTVEHPENAELSGSFYITSTWKRVEKEVKLVYNMDSRVAI